MAIPAGTGKWYWEVNVTTQNALGNFNYGVIKNTINNGSWNNDADVYWNPLSGGASVQRNRYGVTSSGTVFTVASGDLLGFALDATTGDFSIYKNGSLVETWSGAVDTAYSHFPFTSCYSTGEVFSYNFGQYPFTYAPPSGYKSLCTTNLPTPTIQQGNLVMDATLWNGNGSTQTITNAASFKPDFVWVKSRSAAFEHELFDSVRGVYKYLSSNSTAAEDTNTGTLTAFNSNGFTVDSGAYNNASGQTYVGWQWQAGQGTTSSNTSGSITSTVSVNASAGFSVVTYTGTGSAATVGHGLGVAPKFIIAKKRSSTGNWQVYAGAISNMSSGYIILNGTSAFQTDASTIWNNTAPTSSVFTLGSDTDINANGATNVAYCWAEVAGFSKFGSYVGNGSTDGTFVYTGFRPKFIMVKCSSNGSTNWFILDTARDTYNLAGQSLEPNLSNAEYTPASSGYPGDILSNGFKWRDSSNNANNYNGYTYIYAAFAEYPFKSALAR